MTERIIITPTDVGISDAQPPKTRVEITASDVGIEDELKASRRRDGGIVISAAGLYPPTIDPQIDPEDDLAITITSKPGSLDLNALFSKDPEVRHSFFTEQQDQIKRAFPVGISVGRGLTTHAQQEHELDQNRDTPPMSTCVIACTRNSLDAFGKLDPDSDTEEAMIQEIGGQQAFDKNGSLPVMETVSKLLGVRGIDSVPTMNFADMLKNLADGGVSIIAYGEHVRMISGALTTEDGDVSLTVHEPLAHVASQSSLARLMSSLERSGRIYQIVNVIAPSSDEDIEITIK